MRKIEVKTVDEDLKVLFVDNESTGLAFTKAELNAMADELLERQSVHSLPTKRSRSDILNALVHDTVESIKDRTDDGAPLTSAEINEAVRLIVKACKKGWFS